LLPLLRAGLSVVVLLLLERQALPVLREQPVQRLVLRALLEQLELGSEQPVLDSVLRVPLVLPGRRVLRAQGQESPVRWVLVRSKRLQRSLWLGMWRRKLSGPRRLPV